MLGVGTRSSCHEVAWAPSDTSCNPQSSAFRSHERCSSNQLRAMFRRGAAWRGMKSSIVTFSMVILACTTTELTEAGQHVTYADSVLDVSGCDALGPVESGGASVHDHAARTIAIHELRNAAAHKGATHVYVDVQASPDLSRGVAYKCP